MCIDVAKEGLRNFFDLNIAFDEDDALLSSLTYGLLGRIVPLTVS